MQDPRTHRSMQDQRLEGLSTLVGRIADDFSLRLSSILGNTHLLLDGPLGAWERSYLAKIESAAEDASNLCQELLACSERETTEPKPCNLDEIIHDLSVRFRASIAKRAVFECRLAHDLPVTLVDPTQMRVLLMNLIDNASESLDGLPGKVLLRTGSIVCDRSLLERALLGFDLDAGEYVFIEISDSGRGIDLRTQEQIFDPFFTTKRNGRGFGLPTVLGIVRRHRGAISLESEPGRGTTIRVLLPVAPSEPRAASTTSQQIDHSGTVLLVDDEDAVRRVGARMIQRAGYTALTASDGREAVELFDKHVDQIVCVLLDLSMPEMDGEQTLCELRRIRKDLPIILSSGLSQEEISDRFESTRIASFLPKPFRYQQLTEQLNNATSP